MYPFHHHLADLARDHQDALLREAAYARLVRKARQAPTARSHRSVLHSIRVRVAAGLRALAAWIDDGARVETAPPVIGLV